MTENKSKWSQGPALAVLVSILAVLAVYFLLPTKDQDQEAIEKSRVLNFESISIPVVLKEARSKLSDEDKVLFSDLEAHMGDDSLQVEGFKTLSREWFDRGEFILAGHYAEKVAEVEESAEAWGIAGSTYALAMQRYEGQDEVDFTKKRALSSYDKAISLDPENVEYRVNKAVCYAEKPDSDDPMKGIMMLLDLDRNYPEQPSVLNTLAYYGLQTGQVEKAEGRLMKVLEIEPDNRRANCLMARLLRENGREAEAEPYSAKCKLN
jgi:tetratricopeptide (TPR) repeat protein